MSHTVNGIEYPCDDNCNECNRAFHCEDYCPSGDQQKEEPKQEENIKKSENRPVFYGNG